MAQASNVGDVEEGLAPKLFRSDYKTRNPQEFRNGYPRSSLIIGETPEFQNFRRFRRIRARLLLMKQDQICELEKKLDEVDQQEKAQLFLGNMRRDKNQSRKEILRDLDISLAEYDAFLQRSDWVHNLEMPSQHSLMIMRQWRTKVASMAKSETAYLNFHRKELASIGERRHLNHTRIELQIENMIGWVLSLITLIFKRKESVEESIIVSRRMVRELAKIVTAVFTILLLLAPVVGLNAVEATWAKFLIIFIAATVFVVSISTLGEARLGEIFAAGAAYAAVMVVFISGDGIVPS